MKKKVKILIVDDERVLRDLYRTLIKQIKSIDAEVFDTDNAEDTIKILKEQKPNLLIQDLELRKPKGGWDIIRDRRLKRDYLAALKSRIMRHDPDQARELSDEQIIIERELELLDRFVHSAKGSARAATWNEYVKEFPKSFL